ncbi:MAG TPA: hypothetical protein VF300_01390 [Methanothrix sp.]
MDLAIAAVAILGPYLAEIGKGAANKVGEKAFDKCGLVYNYIRQKFSSERDEYAASTLSRLEEQPTNEGRQSALSAILAEKAKEDTVFASELSKLVEESAQAAGKSIILQKAGDNSIQIGQARDVDIHR